jgi:uncharacterized protein (DUF952 family)
VSIIYHIALAGDWEQALEDGQYSISTRGLTLDEVGFIHSSTAAQVAAVANAYYKGASDLLLLVIDTTRVSAEIRWEDVPGSQAPYPHIYGPLNTDEVIEARPFEPGPDGVFSFTAP